MKPSHNSRWIARAALVFVAAVPFVLYARATVGAGMFYFGDIARFFYPTRVLYANALAQGRIGLWQPEILTGIPLLAEMQTGTLYPLHLLLYRFLPIDFALNYDILLHLAWLSAGIYLFARSRSTSIAGAVIAALALTFGGFGVSRITHPNVLSVAAWLPWLLWLYERWRAFSALRDWVLLVLAFAFQWLGGHPQFALINCLVLIIFVTAAPFVGTERTVLRSGSDPREQLPIRSLPMVLPVLAAVVLGTLIASAQLLPTYEFSQQSARAGGVDETFFTQFSFHPFYLGLLVAPFLRGNPYPNTSVEVTAYVGIVPLLLALFGVLVRRDRESLLWIALGIGSLLLAFGGYTPLYPALRGLPFFNLFRVPARFLFPFELALVMLAARGFDALQSRARIDVSLARRGLGLISLFAVVAALLVFLTDVLPIERWLEAWQFLPVIIGGSALIFMLRSTRISTATCATIAIGLSVVDLMAFGAVYSQTYNVIAPRAEIFPRPRVLDVLNLENRARVLTSEWIIPWVSVMNASLYPDLNAAHHVLGAHGYTPLTPRLTGEFLDHPSARMLNLLGVRYYLIPQQLPVDPQTEAADVHDPFIVEPLSQPLEFVPIEAHALEIESSLAQSVNLTDGAVVAEITLTAEDGQTYSVPLRAGFDTAEWAYDRSDVQKVIKHSRPAIASTYPARSAFPVEQHNGHTYLAHLDFADAPVRINRIRIEARIDPGLLHVQRVALVNGEARFDLAPLVGKGDHALVYRSEDVAVYENRDPAARAFISHSARVVTDEQALATLRDPNYDGALLLADGQEMPTDLGQGLAERVSITQYEPEHVSLEVQADFEGYVVLTDAWDPGWIALVDGVAAPIYRADLIFRAVPITSGQHRVEFLYRPSSFYAGLVLSGIGIALLGIASLGTILWRMRSKRL